jgi:hypothetical protein
MMCAGDPMSPSRNFFSNLTAVLALIGTLTGVFFLGFFVGMADSLKNRFEIEAVQRARATDYKDRSASREAVQHPW